MSEFNQGPKKKYVNVTRQALNQKADQLLLRRFPDVPVDALTQMLRMIKIVKEDFIPALDATRREMFEAMSAEEKAQHVVPTDSKATEFALDNCCAMVQHMLMSKEGDSGVWAAPSKKARTE